MNSKPSTEASGFRISLGERGEMVAWNFLRQQGYRLLAKNYRCKIGEIDVVAERNGRIAFVEVKTRAGLGFGHPEESVNAFKQRKMVRLAQWYLKAEKLTDRPVSFDVVSILWPDNTDPKIRLLQDAFTADAS